MSVNKAIVKYSWILIGLQIHNGLKKVGQDWTRIAFTRREVPPPRPLGFDKCRPHELLRWRSDSFRFPPFHYRDVYMLQSTSSTRVRYLNTTERELLMGYGFNHTELAMSASEAKRSARQYEDERLSLIGDAFPVCTFSVAAVAGLQRWITPYHFSHYIVRLGMAPGVCTHVSRISHIQRRLHFGSHEAELCFDEATAVQAVSLFGTKVNHTGSDVRVATGELCNPKLFPRQSISACLWNWKVLFSTKWQLSEHINTLELRAILLSLEARMRKHKLTGRRVLHLSDSFVSVSVLSKGRSSARSIQIVARKIGAILLINGAFLLMGHVDSLENPTDKASRL